MWEGILLFFKILFHFLKHLPFIEDKPKLKILQTMSEKHLALEDVGETDENDGDEEIDKVKRKTGYLCYVPFQNYKIFVIHVGYSCYYQQR